MTRTMRGEQPFALGERVLPARTMPPEVRRVVGRRVGTVEAWGRFWLLVEYDFGRVVGLKTDWRKKGD